MVNASDNKIRYPFTSEKNLWNEVYRRSIFGSYTLYFAYVLFVLAFINWI